MNQKLLFELKKNFNHKIPAEAECKKIERRKIIIKNCLITKINLVEII